MKKGLKIIEYGYLLIAVVFAVETVLNWQTDPQKSWLTAFFTVLAIAMYLFKKRFRKRMENRTGR
ncbi:MAG: hypothetical protein QGH06_04785 [Lutibacter sp.]|jgi:uncharacterized membrane protein|nr:hypothetical protein [Lutibacter sp.]